MTILFSVMCLIAALTVIGDFLVVIFKILDRWGISPPVKVNIRKQWFFFSGIMLRVLVVLLLLFISFEYPDAKLYLANILKL